MPFKRIDRYFNNNNIASTIISIEELANNLFRDIRYAEKITKERVEVKDNEFVKEFFTEEEIEKINSFRTFKRQIEWISGRYAVKLLINKINPGIDFNSIEIDTKKGGSPYIKSLPNIHISITHSKGFAAGAVSLDKNIRLGIDIEKIGKEKAKEFKRLVFTDKEIEYLSSRDVKYMYLSWCVKEAYLKYIEKGFEVSMKKIEYFENDIYVNNKLINELKVHTEIFEDNFIFALVYNQSII